MLDKRDRIFIAGSNGMVGRALTRTLYSAGYQQLLTPARSALDYIDQAAVAAYLKEEKPQVVIIAAAKVGGIWANMTYPAEFIYNNLMIACNLIHESYRAGVDRVLFLGSTCIYPREAPQPMQEDSILTSPLEKTNEAYALAKIAGVKLCQYYKQQYGCRYIAAMPTNLYGIYDNYHPENAHVIPGLINRFHQAKLGNTKEVTIWGTGLPRREFLYVDDMADACLHLLKVYNDSSPINIGSEDEVTILKLAEMIAEVVGYQGTITHDLSKPDGTPRKKTDISRILSLGWRPKIPLLEGLRLSYHHFLSHNKTQ
jgi:GDP-L-fucose synthase